jgi:2-oxoglutarate dehydrogenase E1 component
VLPDSMLSGENADWLDQQYRAWLDDPSAVDAEWAELFAQFDPADSGTRLPGDAPRFRPRSIFAAPAGAGSAESGLASEVAQLVNAYRVRGHMEADIDPLGRRDRTRHPELELAWHGLGEADLEREVPTAPLYGVPPRLPLRDVIAHCRKSYCGAIGTEFMNVMDSEQKQWVLQWLETLPNRLVLDRDAELRVLRKLCDAENFERMLHTRFPGTKRFSLEGGETLIPLLDLVVSESGRRGVTDIVFGMAHRGRLNTLVNILEKPAHLIVSEFQDARMETQGSGDVKYHMGYSGDAVTIHGDRVHFSLTPNPSHLEAVDPVVEGRVRAKQDRDGDTEHVRTMPVLIHGDAAFSGQGLVMETLNLSELNGYRTGGTIHIIVNNQIGFTTPPREGRSTPYCTDIARMLAVPILHVNGEDPRAVAAVVQLAVEWRQRYHRDVVIDMYCYRLHGHNEGDEPSFTQPKMYTVIRARDTPRQHYAEFLTRNGFLTEEDVEGVFEASKAAMWRDAEVLGEEVAMSTEERTLEFKDSDPDIAAYDAVDESVATRVARPEDRADAKGLWLAHVGGDINEETDTGVPLARLVELLHELQELPEGFKPHSKIARLLRQRRDTAAGTRPVDWAMGEVGAFATLLAEGHPVRLSGQDSGRGTFSHRHAVVTDRETGREFYPLSTLGTQFDAIDSSLSEAAVLGFEFGYSTDTPEALVLWEAQFGDFANGAQIIIDQFITAAEQKWGRLSGLTMLLPHGYEGQGPEHSSARLERFLLACGDDNIQVANLTTPANLFHALRRQVKRVARKPLVLMTPKSLLRHPEAVSTLEELAEGAFQRVIGEVDPVVAPEGVRRVVFCSGKVYYELVAERREREQHDVAIVRVELLHPWPAADLDAVIASYGPDTELVWCQEEPRNMGAWPAILHWLMDHVPVARLPRYVGRPASASPATGSHKKHFQEQSRLISDALTL